MLMGPDLLGSFLQGTSQGSSYVETANKVLGITNWSSCPEEARVVLKLLDPTTSHIWPSTLEGMHSMLQELHPDTAIRFQVLIPLFQELFVGAEKFQFRKEYFAAHWEDWKIAGDCMWNSQHHPCARCECIYSFDQYCLEYDTILLSTQDALSITENISQPKKDLTSIILSADIQQELILVTRKMMWLLLGCNTCFGMDGYTYNTQGKRTGQEYYALNQVLPPLTTCSFIPSSIQRIRQEQQSSSLKAMKEEENRSVNLPTMTAAATDTVSCCAVEDSGSEKVLYIPLTDYHHFASASSSVGPVAATTLLGTK